MKCEFFLHLKLGLVHSDDRENQGEVELKNAQQCWNQTIGSLIASLLALAIAKVFSAARVKHFGTTLPARHG